MKLHLPCIKSRHRNTIAFILVYSLSLALYLHCIYNSSSSVQYEVIITWGIDVALVSAPFECAFATQLMCFPCAVWWEMQKKIAYTASLLPLFVYFLDGVKDSQRHRGGGALCIRSRGLWCSFSQAVNQVEACPLLRRTSKGQRKRKQPKRKFILTNLLDV